LAAAVEMKNIVKRFPGVLANDHISLEIGQGEVHALLGENGAGKTTLMNILYGLINADSGEILIKGKPVSISNPADAIHNGIGMVHQHFMLVPVFSVAENVILGERSDREPILDINQAEKRVAELSHSYGLDVDAKAKIWQLAVGTQQRVEIIKALYRGADILIMDEPTSILTPDETEELFVILRRLVKEGHTVIFITHKLREVMAVSDRVTVLRDGKVVNTVNTKDTDMPSLAKMMVGREVFLKFDKNQQNLGEKILELRDVRAKNVKDLLALKGVSFKLNRGEIVGIAGVDGNGQAELSEVIMGLRPVVSGEILIKGRSITSLSTRDIIELCISCIPTDRQKEGLISNFSLSESLLLKEWSKAPFTKNTFFNYKIIRDFCNNMIREYDIRAPNPDVKTGNLSGGNQQKMILARELSRDHDLLIANQPTHGLDIGATEYVRQKLLDERDKGVAVLLISTELDEILSLADRILVIYEGEIMGEVDARDADVHEIGLMMAGAKRQEMGGGPEKEKVPANENSG